MDKTLTALHFISTPFLDGFGSGSKQDPESHLRHMVSTCLTLLEDNNCGQSMAQSSGPPTASWSLVSTSLHLLLRLQNQVVEAEAAQSESERCIEVISIQAQRDFEACVELLIGFGLLPYLLPGVGVPQRVRLPKNPAAIQLFLREDIDLPPLIQFHRLAQVVDGLVALSTQNHSLSALIIPKHTPDILAALFQICYKSIAPPSQTGIQNPEALTQAEYDHVMALRERFTSTHLTNFLSSALVPKNVLLPSLFLIGERPKWMAAACTRVIEKELTSEGGVVLTASTLLLESSPSNVWSLAKIVANLMRTCLNKAKISLTEDEYIKMLERMCSQCLQMISPITYEREVNKNEDFLTTTRGDAGKIGSSSSQQDGNNKELTRIGLFCSLFLMDVDCSTSRRMVWDLLFRPLYQLIPSQKHGLVTENDGITTLPVSVNVGIGQVIDVVEVCEGLLSLILPTGSCLPLHVFQPVWSLIWEVYVLSRNYLERRKVTEPELSQLAFLLKNKIEPVLILLLEIVGSGAGERLDLNTEKNSQKQTIPGATISDGGNNKVSAERSTFLCEFCVSLLFLCDEHDWVTVTRAGGNSLQLVSTHGENDDNDNNPFSHDLSGRVKIVRVLDSELEPFQVLADSCAIFCSVLKQEEDRLSTISSRIFRQLLTFQQNEAENNEKQNVNIHHHPRQETKDKVSSLRKDSSFPKDSSSTLTQLEPILLRSELTELNVASARKFLSLKLLEELGKDDKTVGSCLNCPDYKETLLVVELVLERLVGELKASSETGESYEFSQTIIFALGLLGTIVETGISINQFGSSSSSQGKQNNKLTTTSTTSQPVDNVQDDEFWNELQRFTPHLAEIVDSTDIRLLNLGLNSMAENILTSILSRGVEGLAPGQSEKVSQQSELERALTDVSSPLLPLKGHGLLQLRRLIEARDPETLAKDFLLLNIFQTHLAHEDSYIYLMSVQGLAAFGLKFHGVVIPILIQEYVNVFPEEGGDGGRSKMYASCTPSEVIDCRMKIGEVLVRVIQGLGQFAPHYRVPLCNALFRIGREEEPLLRASALSNLGELCHLLKFSLGSILTEVWVNVEWILNWEKDLSVRRAAFHLLVLLLKGVQKEFEPSDLLEDVQIGGHLRDVRRLLTRIQEREPDPVSKTHAQLALSELEGIVTKLLGPLSTQGELSYKIRVLGAIE